MNRSFIVGASLCAVACMAAETGSGSGSSPTTTEPATPINEAFPAPTDPTPQPASNVGNFETDPIDKELAAEDRARVRTESNHNAPAATNPIGVAYADRPDYNPQREPSSRGNLASASGGTPAAMEQKIEAKADSPTAAEIVEDRRERAADAYDEPLAKETSPYLGEI